MLLGTVVVLSVLSTCLLLSAHGWVCSREGKKHILIDRKYDVMRTIDAKVLNPNGPKIFVQNGDAAHSCSKRQVID